MFSNSRTLSLQKQSVWQKGANLYWFLALVLCYVCASIIGEYYLLSDTVYYNTFADRLAYDEIYRMLESQRSMRWAGYILQPVLLTIKLSLVAFCIMCAVVWGNLKISFRQIWSLIIRAELVLAIGALFASSYIAIFWEVHSFDDLGGFHNFSLLAFLPEGVDTSQWYVYPLQLINIFELFYWLALVSGIQKILKFSWKDSLKFVAKSYGLGLIIWVLLITFIKLNFGS
ncbi:MAG: hypothetical protein AAF927_14450 [Bacteroidota bacterium]